MLPRCFQWHVLADIFIGGRVANLCGYRRAFRLEPLNFSNKALLAFRSEFNDGGFHAVIGVRLRTGPTLAYSEVLSEVVFREPLFLGESEELLHFL